MGKISRDFTRTCFEKPAGSIAFTDIPPHFAFPPQLLSALPDLGTKHPPCAFLSVENRSTRPIFGALPGSHFQASMASPSAVGDVGDTGVALGLFPRQRLSATHSKRGAPRSRTERYFFFTRAGRVTHDHRELSSTSRVSSFNASFGCYCSHSLLSIRDIRPVLSRLPSSPKFSSTELKIPQHRPPSREPRCKYPH